MTFVMIGSNSFLAQDTLQRRRLEWAFRRTTGVKLGAEKWSGMEGVIEWAENDSIVWRAISGTPKAMKMKALNRVEKRAMAHVTL